ncbi:MAG TPA: carbohydrate porin [Gemmatimonadales bacterium]|nr:carbohydrate porin [Gemmatimonadales bacterium]
MMLPLLVLANAVALLQQDSASGPAASSQRVWLSGQVNVVSQWHPSFAAAYTGPNSLQPAQERATSVVATLYTGVQLGAHTELILDLESSGGGGLSQALGLAGFTNLDVVRNPTLGSAPYVARALIRHTFALSGTTQSTTRGPLNLMARVPTRRLSVTAGKLSVVDVFDANSVGSDSHWQYLNWTVDNNGAYDYAADTRGYTIGAIVEYQDRSWAVRFAEALMPTVANGIDYDWDLAHAHADNLEIEWRHGSGTGSDGVIRGLLYLNHANMGKYSEAIDAYRAGIDSVPDITAHRQVGRTKPGAGLNLEQGLGRGLRVFARAGINDGKIESFAYTECDETLELGLGWLSPHWRPDDRVGVAFVTNGLSSDHRDYLALGGLGFLLGDGALTYGREQILETFYTLSPVRWAGVAFDYQHIVNPGYNRDRGPVDVFGLRIHLEVAK